MYIEYKLNKWSLSFSEVAQKMHCRFFWARFHRPVLLVSLKRPGNNAQKGALTGQVWWQGVRRCRYCPFTHAHITVPRRCRQLKWVKVGMVVVEVCRRSSSFVTQTTRCLYTRTNVRRVIKQALILRVLRADKWVLSDSILFMLGFKQHCCAPVEILHRVSVLL